MLTTKASSLLLMISAFVMLPGTGFSFSLKDRVDVCDSFYSTSDAPKGQEAQINGFEGMMMDRLVSCLNTYEEAGQQNKFDYAMAMHEEKISSFRGTRSNIRTADCREEDREMTSSTGADLLDEINEEFSSQKVIDIHGFKDSRADTRNFGTFLGHFKIPRHPLGSSCNASYVEYENGMKGIVSNAHCFFSNGKLRAPLSEYEIEFGFQLGKSSNQKIKVLGLRCGTINPMDSNNSARFNDECFLETSALPRNVKPIERVFLSIEEQRELQRNRKISAIAFHPERPSSVIYGMDKEGPFPSNSTRTIQTCRIKNNAYDVSGLAKFLIHDCDTLGNSSGAAIIIWNRSLKKPQMIGMHRGAENINDPNANNLAINVFPSELTFENPSTFASN